MKKLILQKSAFNCLTFRHHLRHFRNIEIIQVLNNKLLLEQKNMLKIENKKQNKKNMD